MFSLSCEVEKKNNAYNTLIIIVKQKKFKYFKDFEINHVSNEIQSFVKKILDNYFLYNNNSFDNYW